MILNIRGTSGSGKSTIVREIMKLYGNYKPHFVTGRKRPLMYLARHPSTARPGLAVLGHYETPCGGCDTITEQDEIFALVRKRHYEGFDVLFEGLLISAEFNRTAALHADGLPLAVCMLDIPLDVCLASVNDRRKAKWGEDKGPVNPANTENKWKGTRRTCDRLKVAGVPVFCGDRLEVLEYAKGALAL